MKGFVGGIPLALLATAALAQDLGRTTGNAMGNHGFQERRAEGGVPFHGHNGGTAMGGPSGDDSDGGFTSPYSAKADVNSNVNEFSKDDHSVKVKDTHVHPPPHPMPYGVALGHGPFGKRSFPNGGTAGGGPSGNDEGQVFNMPMTADVHTNVNDVNQDDHHIDVKNKDIHPPPVFAPVIEHGPPPGFEGPPPESTVVGGTAMGGPGNGHSHGGPSPVGHNGGTAMGGPSGDDDGVNFGAPNTANVHSNVNEFSKDDHSVDLKHKDVYPPPHHPAFVPGPHFKRGWHPENGGTAMGGPSGNDGGQTFSQPYSVNTHANVNEAHKDDHSVDLKHTDVYPPPHVAPVPPFPAGGPGPVVGGPFRRDYPNGGTAMGGPSGDDDGVNFAQPNNVDVNSSVNEHHEDNHAIKADTTDVHPPPYEGVPWTHYAERPQVEQPSAHHAPPVHAPPVHEEPAVPARGEEEHTPQCAGQVHEVVHTVTKTQYKMLTPTETVYRQAMQNAAESSAVPMAHVAQSSADPMVHGAQSSAMPMAHVAQTSAVMMPSGVDPKMHGSMVGSAPAAASTPVVPYNGYNYHQERPMSSSAAYSMIPVHVPMATPASSSYKSMMTPGASMGPMASGVSPVRSAKASGSASASASPSHGAMFTGAASSLSASIASAAAAVAGVLAFVL
ncbi:hypothetical protein N7492_009248 [Penicillium capsulatum]|uniref:GPI anchored protein n=1 Tax=Penicillium capsulatum TaxID=69766 RepID=A0A9W9LI26_9EURO|nr:hypothetical protein N7492_009248 [Penicillium capsulatum]